MKTAAGLLLCALIALFIATVCIEIADAQGCPNNCSGRGSCFNGICHCNTGFGEPDCSVAATQLVLNRELTGQTVDGRSWKYYETTANEFVGTAIRWTINTIGPGDCDAFVQAGRFPTRSDYLVRSISTDANFTIEANITSQREVYYIGIYGFSSSTIRFNIMVREHRECFCNNHGFCGPNLVCRCFNGWAGENCQYPLKALTFNQRVNTTVTAGHWMYFDMDIEVENVIMVIVNQTNAHEDVDLFIRYNEVPTQWNYDYADRSLNKDVAVEVQLNNRKGKWYIGVYGFTSAQFSIYYTLFTDCPSACSMHGQCGSHAVCNCVPGYTGTYCETKTAPLRDGEVAQGFVADNSWNWYQYTPQSVASMLIKVQQYPRPGADCDIYVRKNQRPNLLDFDLRNVSLAQTSTVRIDGGQFQTWDIGVFGFRICQYNITVENTDNCPPCQFGTCDAVNGMCVCQKGWTGTKCDQAIKVITDWFTPLQGQLARSAWQYYQVDVQAGTELSVHLLEKSTQGYFWLFVLDKNVPNLIDYNPAWTDRESNTAHHSVYVSASVSDTYYIGVYGSPFGMGDNTQEFPYELQVWDSPF